MRKLLNATAILFSTLMCTVSLTCCSDMMPVGVKTSTASDVKVRWKENNHSGLEYLGRQDYKKAIAMFKSALKDAREIGPDCIEVAATHNNLAAAYGKNGQGKKAIPEYEDAISTFKKAAGPSFRGVATASANLADLYNKDGDSDKAASLYKQALYIQEYSEPPPYADIAENLHKLGNIYHEQGKLTLAEPLYRNTVKYRVEAHGQKHPLVLQDLKDFAGVLHEQGKIPEARAIEKVAARVNSDRASAQQDQDASSQSTRADNSRR